MVAPTTIDEYINGFPEDVQSLLQQMRHCIMTTASELTESINYGIPTFKWKGRNLVHFGGYKNHIGFYPAPSAIAAFANALEPFKKAKGSVQFPIQKALPLDLVQKMVEFRLEEEKLRARK